MEAIDEAHEEYGDWESLEDAVIGFNEEHCTEYDPSKAVWNYMDNWR